MPLREQAAKAEKDGEGSGGPGAALQAEDVAALDDDWVKWRKEWVARKRVYRRWDDPVVGSPTAACGD